MPKVFRDPITPPDPRMLAILKLQYRNDFDAVDAISRAPSAWILRQKFEKIVLLAKEYGVDLEAAGGPLNLALILAEKHEPGFQVKGFDRVIGAVGRPANSHKIDASKLCLDVQEYLSAHPGSDASHAITELCRRGQPWHGHDMKSLRTTYSRFKKFPMPDENDPFVASVRQVLGH